MLRYIYASYGSTYDFIEATAGWDYVRESVLDDLTVDDFIDNVGIDRKFLSKLMEYPEGFNRFIAELSQKDYLQLLHIVSKRITEVPQRVPIDNLE